MACLHKHDNNNRPQTNHLSGTIQHNPLFDSDLSSRVIDPNNDIYSNESEVGFGLGFVLDDNSNNNNNNNNNNSDNRYCDEETDIISVVDVDCDEEETSFHLSWDSFHIQDNQITPPNPNPNPNSNSNAHVNEDFEWEEVDNDDRIDERGFLSMFFSEEPDVDASVSPVILTGFAQVEEPIEQHDALEWQVLSNVQNFGPDLDSEDQYDEYNYTEYEMFFGQFGDSDVASSSGRPPASKTAVGNLSNVVMTREYVVKTNVLCAVCKDEMVVGEMATQLPCSHRYHGDCILPWLAVRNTCPVCRYELPTDDPDYERRKAVRGGQA